MRLPPIIPAFRAAPPPVPLPPPHPGPASFGAAWQSSPAPAPQFAGVKRPWETNGFGAGGAGRGGGGGGHKWKFAKLTDPLFEAKKATSQKHFQVPLTEVKANKKGTNQYIALEISNWGDELTINIREYFEGVEAQAGTWFHGQKGINLSVSAFTELVRQLPALDAAFQQTTNGYSLLPPPEPAVANPPPLEPAPMSAAPLPAAAVAVAAPAPAAGASA